MSHTVDVSRGRIYLSATLCDTYFRGIDAVIVIVRDATLQVMPVNQMAAGGCLLKVRNKAGDRIASAPDVFVEHGLLDWAAENLPVVWSSDDAALMIQILQE